MSSDRSGVLCPSPTVPERKNTELSLDSHRFGTVLRKQYARRFEEPTSSLGRSSARRKALPWGGTVNVGIERAIELTG
ncbi:hypothetical protein KL909_001607 [Ogataea angusta]|nr:hypothetical protein KL909_001607 [Ogataea angusta]